ncbi:hypothetical protein [Oceanobacillus sp. FSL H7-0719]|uniref:hypothetical protein n=1 Tax=Oceanobacillus sp. FSL H7-0719 TaxID=2954507 RepID=UPI00324D9961
MKRNGIWLPLLASIGVGAATFYSMSKNNQGLDQMMQQFMPGNSTNSGSTTN